MANRRPLSRRAFLARGAGGLLLSGLPPTRGSADPAAAGLDAMDELRRAFTSPPDAAKPMTRWWWFGGAVTPAEITRELTFMKEAGLRGAEIQPVYPLAVDDPRRGIRHLRYFSDEWYAVLRHAVREARRLGLQLDFTLGSGWPYGGPFVPTAMAARRLRLLAQDVAGPREYSWDVTPLLTGDDRVVGVVAAPQRPDGALDLARSRVLADQPVSELAQGVRRGSFVRLQAPEGVWRLMLFVDSPTGQQVKRPTLGMEGNVLDHHSRAAADLFLRAAGDRVMDALGAEAGPPFHSVFCDSLEVYGADWTETFLAEFRRRRGYELGPLLPALFHEAGPDTPHVRHDTRLTLSELNLESFFTPLVEWAAKRGMKARVQAHGAPGDVMRAYGLAHVPEGENIFLGDRYQVNLRHRRLASSAAHLYGKPLASSETYTWLRTPLFTTSLEMMKPATDAVLLDGLNHIVNHGYSYSPPEAGEPGWAFYASTEANHTNTWWRHYPLVARYVQRACSLLQRGVSVNPVAVYLPVADLFSQFGSGGLHIDVEAEGLIDARLFSGLRQAGYDFDLIHDHALESLARVDQGRLRAGTGAYDVVVVPAARWMPAASLARLAELARAGGHVIFVERAPEGPPGLSDRTQRLAAFRRESQRLWPGGVPAAGDVGVVGHGSFAIVADVAAALRRLRGLMAPDFEIVESGDGGEGALQAARENVGFLHRREGGLDWYFVANLSHATHDLRVRFDAGQRRPERWDPESGAIQRSLVYAYATAGRRPVTEVALRLLPLESCFVTFGGAAEAPLVTRSDWRGPLRIARAGGRTEVEGVVSANGSHVLTLAGGRTHRFEVAGIPDPIPIDGPWRLDLARGVSLELAQLRSWTELPEARGFSGWGRYEASFELPGVTEGLEWILDLGRVHETAEAFLNGKPLGAAWKGLRRLACGDALRSGRNQLRVEVANLWIQAMVEREPPPEWKTVEETFGIRWGRYGEVKPEKLPPAGLLGPVRLLAVRRQLVRV